MSVCEREEHKLVPRLVSFVESSRPVDQRTGMGMACRPIPSFAFALRCVALRLFAPREKQNLVFSKQAAIHYSIMRVAKYDNSGVIGNKTFSSSPAYLASHNGMKRNALGEFGSRFLVQLCRRRRFHTCPLVSFSQSAHGYNIHVREKSQEKKKSTSTSSRLVAVIAVLHTRFLCSDK